MTDNGTPRSLIAERIAAAPVDAELSEQDGTWTLTVRRTFAHGPAQLWRMLTDPAQLARWSPVVPDRPLTSAGPATSRETPDMAPVDAEVLRYDPERELVHRWGPSTLRWLLRAVPDGTLLTLEHSFGDRENAPSYGAGWHVCLAVLAALDAGEDVPRVVGADALDHGWTPLQQHYAARLR